MTDGFSSFCHSRVFAIPCEQQHSSSIQHLHPGARKQQHTNNTILEDQVKNTCICSALPFSELIVGIDTVTWSCWKSMSTFLHWMGWCDWSWLTFQIKLKSYLKSCIQGKKSSTLTKSGCSLFRALQIILVRLQAPVEVQVVWAPLRIPMLRTQIMVHVWVAAASVVV